MLNSVSDQLRGNIRAQFENLDVLRLRKRHKRGEINGAGARRAMVTAGERNVVDVESPDTVAQRFQVQGMTNEPKIFLYLRVPGIVPIDEAGTGQLPKKKLVITFERQFLEALTVFNSQFQSARFCFGQKLFECLLDAFQERFLPRLALCIQLCTEFFVSRSR